MAQLEKEDQEMNLESPSLAVPVIRDWPPPHNRMKIW